MEARTTTTARIWLDGEGIVHYVATGTPSTKETVGESLAVVREITGGRRTPILFDSRSWPSGDPASWVHFINTIESFCSAAGVVVDGQSVARLGAFPARIDDLIIPFQVFYSEEEALAFLRSHTTD